jgi:polysaccharide pyruvyl transferase WcaK-like protein
MADPRSPASRRHRIAVFNVKYSANVGDGAIAESLEAELARHGSVERVTSIDLAGRSAYGQGLRHRGTVMAVLQRLSPGLREAVSSALLRALTEFRLRPVWRKSLDGQTAVMIGGGQLIQGTDLNFPVKLNAAMREVRRRKLPCVVYGVGVAHTLSPQAARLFRRAFAGNLSAVFVRDAESQAAWDRHFPQPDIPRARLCWDPAVLMDAVVPSPSPAPRTRSRIGVGVAAPLVLAHHALDQHFDAKTMDDFWASLAAGLVDAGFDIAWFTNGAEEDETYLDQLLQKIGGIASHHVRIPRPTHPQVLAKSIAECDGIVSHRLHANILAFAYRKAHVGLTWDAKLTSFFRATGRPECAMPATRDNVAPIVALLKRDVENGLPLAAHERIQVEARTMIGQAAGVLNDAIAAEAPGSRPASQR